MLTSEEAPQRPYFLALDRVLGSVPQADLAPLVSEDARRRIARLAGELGIPVQTACYECRLAANDDRVDLAACLFPPDSPAPTDLGQSTAFSALRGTFANNADWTRTLELLEAWSAPGSSLRGRIPFIWIAFDIDRELSRLPSPCVGLCIDPAFFARRLDSPHQVAEDISTLETLADSFNRFFAGAGLTDTTKALLRACLEEPGLEAKHLSYMLGRASAPFKLDVRLDVDRVADYLQRIGWPGPARKVAASLRELAPSAGKIQLNLVLQPQLTQPLEVEFFTMTAEAPAVERKLFLETLVAKGLCSPDKADVLWRLVEEPVGDAGGQAVARGWYVKVRFIDDVPTEAKAYLGLMPRPGRSSSGGAP